jgi:indole-3-glycerol phosphate synthase
MTVLEKICELKSIEIKELKRKVNYKKNLKLENRRGFIRNLIKENKDNYNLIAEIKRSSPSKGEICKNFNLKEIAIAYESAGASCLSILTERNFFQGHIEYIQEVRKIVNIPILRKDFIIDEWQIYESYYHGADCILLILAILDDKKATTFYNIAKTLNMDVIIEVHDLNELNRALRMKVNCIGINNRNLKTLKVDLDNFQKLSKVIPKDIVKICESGISDNYQLKNFYNLGANAFLVGESLMSSEKIKEKTISLIKK